VGKVGAGGMGTVYAGLGPGGGYVAVKVIHAELADDPDFRDRFTREVSVLERVRGRCVPALLGADPGADPPWLVTEFVAGRTLDDHARRHGPLSSGMLDAFAAGTAEALRAIHAAGIVHRDLKPGNVILASDGPKLLDFGIARALGETALTRTGGLVGTPGWVAPELYRGEAPSPAGDIFAWGALLVYAATGRHPFGTGTPDVLAYRVMQENPDLTGVPDRLRVMVSAALAKEPGDRPEIPRIVTALTGAAASPPARTADEDEATTVVGRMLDRDWTRVSVPTPLPPARRRRRRFLATAAGAGAALVAAVATAVLLATPFSDDEADDAASGGGTEAAAAGEDEDASGNEAWNPEEASAEGRNGDFEAESSIETADAELADLWETLAPGDEYGSLSHWALAHREAATIIVAEVHQTPEGVEFTAGAAMTPAGLEPEVGLAKLAVVTPDGRVSPSEDLTSPESSVAGPPERTLTFDGAPAQGLLALVDEDYVEDVSGAPPVGVCYDAEAGTFSVDFATCL
jgi:eukaryotic-like serine/threonine-protein kinase